jgi:amino acid adenylation domain-containing protein
VLALCLGEIVRRHETLRTVFAVRDGLPVQVIRPAEPFVLPVVDLSGLPERSDRSERAERTLAADEAARPFDLARDPQLRATLLKLAAGEHIILLTIHHIACDSWSVTILIREVMALYPAFAAGRPSPLPEPPVQYADFAVWQTSWLRGATLETELAFWRTQLAGLPPVLSLPTDRPRPPVQSFRGAARPLQLPAGLVRPAQALGRREGATLFMVLLAAFQTLLARLGGQGDLAVATPIAGRTRVEVEGLIGFFINTLVLRGNLTGPDDLEGGPSFRELLGQARDTALAAYQHQDVPFEKLVEELSPERRLDHAPLVQVMLILQNAPVETLEIESLRLRPISNTTDMAKFDLTVNLEEREGGLAGTVQYSTDLFDATTIDRLILQYERLLTAAVALPEETALKLPLLGEEERQQIRVEWNDTRPASPPGLSLAERFFAVAARWPEAVALRLGADALPYGELARRVRRRAAQLGARGVGAGTVTALCLDRSFEMVEAVLAVLAAGGAWVALDPFSTDRVRASLLEQVRPGLLLTQDDLDELDGEGAGPAAVDPASLAYVSFTSGSTGEPKGILGTHGALASYLDYLEVFWPLSPEDRVLQVARLSFDASCRDLLYPLTRGAGVVLLSGDEAREPAALLREARRQGATCILSAVPSLLRALVDAASPGAAGEAGGTLRLVLASGEPLPWELCRRVRETFGAAIVMANQYGPSECTLTATVYPVPREVPDAGPDAGLIPAGRPIPGLLCRVLDPLFQEAPAGVVGQVFLGGAGVTRGYLNRPDLTAERFLPDPFSSVPGERLYATGDLGRRRADGLLELQGRLDHQVKLRGIRVEPGEIEAALLALDGVREAVVVARSDGSSAPQRLIAYLVGGAEADALREQLRERLPEHLVPAAFVPLPALPRTPNGKVDRKALPEPSQQPAGDAYVAPRSPLEEVLAGMWAELLGLERVGVRDDFFAIGGQSLLAAQLIAQVREIFPGELPLRALFAAPTVAGLAAALLHDPARREQVERTAELMLEIADASEEDEEVLAT